MAALQGRRWEMQEPLRSVAEVRLTRRDREFLKALRIRWE